MRLRLLLQASGFQVTSTSDADMLFALSLPGALLGSEKQGSASQDEENDTDSLHPHLQAELLSTAAAAAAGAAAAAQSKIHLVRRRSKGKNTFPTDPPNYDVVQFTTFFAMILHQLEEEICIDCANKFYLVGNFLNEAELTENRSNPIRLTAAAHSTPSVFIEMLLPPAFSPCNLPPLGPQLQY